MRTACPLWKQGKQKGYRTLLRGRLCGSVFLMSGHKKSGGPEDDREDLPELAENLTGYPLTRGMHICYNFS